jgi:hypothetical protein
MQNTDQNSPKPETTYRSRFGRFSPSMGWKAFWSEILIVVLGIVIALGATEIVEEWNWQNKVRDGETRLNKDTQRAFLLSAEQFVTSHCVNAQLVVLTQSLINSKDTLIPASIYTEEDRRYVVRLPNRPYIFPIWDSLIADGTATRFSSKRQTTYNFFNDNIAVSRGQNEEANRLAWRLLALGHPIALSDDARRNFMVDVEELRARTSSAAQSSGQLMKSVAEFSSLPKANVIDESLQRSGTVKFCKAHNFPLADWRDALK